MSALALFVSVIDQFAPGVPDMMCLRMSSRTRLGGFLGYCHLCRHMHLVCAREGTLSECISRGIVDDCSSFQNSAPSAYSRQLMAGRAKHLHV